MGFEPSRGNCCNGLHLLLVAFSFLLPVGALQASTGWYWQEAEKFVAQQGASRIDGKRAAASFQCLGMGWGATAGDFAEYAVELDEPIPNAMLHLRYARRMDTPAEIRFQLQGPIEQTKSLELPPSPGWGSRPEDWRFRSASIGSLPAGQYHFEFVAPDGQAQLNLDGFYLAPANDPPAGLSDPSRLLTDAIEQDRDGLKRLRDHEPQVRRLDVQGGADFDSSTSGECLRKQLDRAAKRIPAGMRSMLASKPSPYLVNAHDVGEPTDFNRDIPWHVLEKEIDPRFDLPHRGKLGLVNPTSDVNWLIGMAIDSRGDLQEVDLSPPHRCTDHLINLVAWQIDLQPVAVDLAIMPVASDVALAILDARNQSDSMKTLQVRSIVSKPEVALLPEPTFGYGITPTTGKLQWVAPLDASGAISAYNDWSPQTFRPIGTLLCLQQGDRDATETSWRISETGVPNATVCDYELSIPPGESRQLRLGIALHRFGSEPYETPRQVVLYPEQAEDAAIRYVADRMKAAFAQNFETVVVDSYEWYQRLPRIDLGNDNWNAAAYCAMELPRANTWSPQDRINRPWYTFCRAHGHEPYGWWSYGMHGHEHLSTFVTNLTEPALSQAYLRGHFQVQRDDGSIQYGVNHRLANIHGWLETCPFLMTEAWSAYCWSGDKAFLAKAYEAGRRYVAWWRSAERTRAGAPLQHWNDFIESVRDDADLATWTATETAEQQEALDLNCYLLNEERALAAMAEEINDPEGAATWHEAVDERIRAMRTHLLHPADGIYYGRDVLGHRWARVLDISTFFPLTSGLANEAEAERIVELLSDPTAFGTPYPVASLAAQHMPEHLRGEHHWRGANWVEMSWLAIQGLRQYGFYDEAARLAEANCRMVFETLHETGHFREYYNSLTGEPAGLTDYIWTAMPAAMVVEVFFGVRPTAGGVEILPAIPPSWSEIRIEDLRLRDKRLSIHVRRDETVPQTQVSVNGRATSIVHGRGTVIRWAALPDAARIAILQPARITTTAEARSLFELPAGVR